MQEDQIQDELPEDLNVTELDQEDYIFPNNNRRRIPGYIYLVVAAILREQVGTVGGGERCRVLPVCDLSPFAVCLQGRWLFGALFMFAYQFSTG